VDARHAKSVRHQYLTSGVSCIPALELSGRTPTHADQALFVKASTYHALGGFKEWPLLEDYEMVLKLRKVSPPALVQPPLSVHGRRWRKLGFLQNTVRCLSAAPTPVRLDGWIGLPRKQPARLPAVHSK